MYYWGCYRNQSIGQKSPKQEDPVLLFKDLFDSDSKLKLKKVVSGSNHSVALTQCGRVFAWGDQECGKTGKNENLRTRKAGNEGTLEELWPNKIADKNVANIFSGNNHSFYINKKNQVYAWGQNNMG